MSAADRSFVGPRPDLYRSNTRRSGLIVATFAVFAGAVGFGLGSIAGRGVAGAALALVIAACMIWLSVSAGDRIVLAAVRAQRDVTDPRLDNIVEGLCIAADLPKPSLYIVEDSAMNAVSAGRDPNHAHLAVTRGLLEKANRVELEGVVAHELAHIKDRDTLVTTLLATLVGAALLLSDWLGRTARNAMGTAEAMDPAGPTPMGRIVLAAFIAVVTLMPLTARVLRLFLSHHRELVADITASRFTRYPPGLVSALRTIERNGSAVAFPSRATAALWFASPLASRPGLEGRLDRLFDVQPPVADRIQLLSEL